MAAVLTAPATPQLVELAATNPLRVAFVVTVLVKAVNSTGPPFAGAFTN